MRDLTALGSAPVLVLFVLAVAGSLLVRRQYHALALLLVATIGGILLMMFLKGIFARPRPPSAFHLSEVRSVRSLSFPSGHAMESAIIYLTLAALLARLVQTRVLKLYFIGLAVVPDLRRRVEPRLPRRALSERRAGRVDHGPGLGAPVLDGGALPPAEGGRGACPLTHLAGHAAWSAVY